MLARNEIIFKWSLYAGATVLLLLLQGSLLQRITLWGVIPFLYPALAAVLGNYENPVPSSIFGLGLGVVCDLLLPGPIPCLYTLVFPLAALSGALISKSLLKAGWLCALVSAAAGFLLTDLFRCLLLWAAGKPAWGAGLWVMVREFAATAPFLLLAVPLFSAVHRRVHLYD
ncbi:hypothetical protein [Dysosmobacter sp.]|uniref:hypothetical protein n=1 Tax=Dysosmobacter sp. TaxID=2591382 RepID=UPI002A947239|nr:hypothetical protein [Dysosmobacter sp.]MCI6053901.1 hypothetical protein [Dysosmobacter sp.]MDY5511344.1 hypothetical protein [Dysosmobacter sp.]